MGRSRLVLLVTIVALIAPWVAPCLASAPAGHAAMACCHPPGSSTPAARPCCLPADGQPAAPASPVVSLSAMTTAIPLAWLGAAAATTQVAGNRSALPPFQPLVRFSVLLI